MNLKGVFSHESDHWKTPKKLYDAKQSAPFPTMIVRLNSEIYENSFCHGTAEDFIRLFEEEFEDARY